MPTPEEVGRLAEAMWQVLDDMGAEGRSVCLGTKALARVAFEPFLQADFAADASLAPDYAPDMSLREAQAVLAASN
jgi:hypothetical protein